MLLILYPKCSTCKKAESFFKEHDISYEVKDIVLNTPSVNELKGYIKMSGLDISRFFNTSGMKYRELGLKDKLKVMSYEDKVNLLASDGMLIKRPLLIGKDFVLVGFHEKEWSNKVKYE